MIRRIRGELGEIGPETVEVIVGGLGYEVVVPPAVADHLGEREQGSEIELHTYEFMVIEGVRGTPVLMGFETPAQRDFFERLLDIPRFGPRSAIRSITIPVATYAKAIELGDTKLLRSLPGVGAQKAKDMVATLQGKVGRFIDVAEVEAARAPGGPPESDVEEQALLVLEQLGMTRADALRAVLHLRDTQPDLQTADQIVKAVFRR
jgi:Holliday junction DNA helicase RuvA